MKLYISYYGNYVSIIEGSYNSKKDKYNIKRSMIISSKDIPHDENDKYGLLKEALRLDKWKTKNVVLCLNTRDVIIKSNNIDKISSKKDLDGIMNNEMYEIMSLNEDQYTFSYEVVKERNDDGKETLDIIMAAILNEELESIINIFKEFKLNVERIDTIATAYSRILKKIEYNDIMMIDIGEYGSIVNIFKEDSLFINDNIPIRINEHTNYSTALALINEVHDIMNFYSSRNYGRTVETMVLVGEHNDNKEIVSAFKEAFNNEIIVGIENLFDINEDIIGDLQIHEISKVCDILGSMLVKNYGESYSTMNLLPYNLRNRQNQKYLLKKSLLAMPIVLGILVSPNLILGAMQMKVEHDTKIAQAKLEEITTQYKDIETIESDISKAQEEIGVYDMLSSKSARWGGILTSIDRSIPYRAELTNIDVTYDNSVVELEETDDNTEDTQTEESVESQDIPIYDQIPNRIVLDGVAYTPEKIGQFIYSLNQISYFKSVELKSSAQDEESGGYTFNIVLEVMEDAVSR